MNNTIDIKMFKLVDVLICNLIRNDKTEKS